MTVQESEIEQKKKKHGSGCLDERMNNNELTFCVKEEMGNQS